MSIVVTKNMVKDRIPSRDEYGHKGTFGRVYALCGSEMMFGAASFSVRAALMSGCGLCTIGASAQVCQNVVLGCPEAVGHAFSDDLPAENLLEEINKNAVAVIGSGLSSAMDQRVRDIVKGCKIPMVIDGGGIRAIAQEKKLFVQISAPFIITPHPGEMSAITGCAPAEINSDRENITLKTAAEIGGVVLLKGKDTVISDGKTSYTIPTGNDGMATPGSGDVLGGIIAGLIAQGASVLDAGIAGAYLHGLAGDIGAAQRTKYCFIASDFFKYLPQAFGEVLK